MMDQAQKLRSRINKNNSVATSNSSKAPINIYTIASGKGGVGKTNMVVNLAIALQSKGKKVLIIDADLGLANVDVVMGLYPKYTLYDVLFKDRDLKDAILLGPKGIKILPGGSGMMEMANLSIERQERFAKEFITLEDIDTILIDTGAGLSKNLLSFITFSQEVILVTTPEPTSLTDVYSVIKVLATYKLKKNIKIVINRAQDSKMAKSTFDKLKKTSQAFLLVSLDSLGYVVDDKRVALAVMNQSPFIIDHPSCLASKCINEIADSMIGQKKSQSKIKSVEELYNRFIKVFS